VIPGATLARPVLITEGQRRLHVASEWVAVALVVPALGWVALNPRVPRTARWIAGAVAVGSLLVDGYLLTRWKTPQPRRQRGR
jgi:hypothetical protein